MWKQYWVPQWIKKGVPGEKYLGKDHDGWEYTSHDLWKKKLIWKSYWKKHFVTHHKTIWVNTNASNLIIDLMPKISIFHAQIPKKKLTWTEGIKHITRTEQVKYFIDDKKLAWKAAWLKSYKTETHESFVTSKKLEWDEKWVKYQKPSKKLEWVTEKKLEWKEAWKQVSFLYEMDWRKQFKILDFFKITVPDYKDIWLPAWKKIWKPVVISEWFPTPDHHDDHHHHPEWVADRKDTTSQSKVVWKRDNKNSELSAVESTVAPLTQNKNISAAPSA